MPNNPHLSPPAQDRDPTVAIIMTVLSAGLVTGLSLYLAANLVNRFMPNSEERCSEDNPCNEGLLCNRAGKCEPDTSPTVCRENDPDQTCYCPAPRVRDEASGSCQRKPLLPASCDGEVYRLLAELMETQKSCKKSIAGNITSCEPEDIRKFMLKEKQFNRILNRAPSTSWVLFPPARPKLDGSWPNPATFDKYLKNLSYDVESLREASYILVLSHATLDKNPTNDALLQQRISFAYKLILALRKDEPGWQASVRPKLMGFPIPPEQPIKNADFQPLPGVHLPDVNVITGDNRDQVRYSKAFESLRNPDSGVLTQQEYDDLENALNRSVTIIPIFCPLPTEEPQPTAAL